MEYRGIPLAPPMEQTKRSEELVQAGAPPRFVSTPGLQSPSSSLLQSSLLLFSMPVHLHCNTIGISLFSFAQKDCNLHGRISDSLFCSLDALIQFRIYL